MYICADCVRTKFNGNEYRVLWIFLQHWFSLATLYFVNGSQLKIIVVGKQENRIEFLAYKVDQKI